MPTLRIGIVFGLVLSGAWESAIAADPSDVSQPAAAPSQESRPLSRDDFAARRQRLQQQPRQPAQRPTAWQLQNPSNIDNRTPTSPQLDGYVAPNTYFGPQFREWSHLSPPVSQTQRPANITAVPLLPQAGVPIAPYSYWGADNARWSHVTIGRSEPSPTGGWRMRPGW